MMMPACGPGVGRFGELPKMPDLSEQREIIAEWCESEATEADKVAATVNRYIAQEWHRWRAGWLRMQAAELRASHD